MACRARHDISRLFVYYLISQRAKLKAKVTHIAKPVCVLPGCKGLTHINTPYAQVLGAWICALDLQRRRLSMLLRIQLLAYQDDLLLLVF